METSDEPPRKKRRLSNENEEEDQDIYQADRRKLIHESLTRPVSPPPLSRLRPTVPITKVIRSPFQLTSIRDLPPASNIDTVTLKEILSDPLISECWDFNYLHDLDFLMDAFDEDVRALVRVNVIHGFWKREDESRLRLIEQAKKYPNIKLLTAYMPEMFGTHHSKMLIVFRHDDTAEVIIHTANMIPFDWANMTQAAWRSPKLPKRKPSKPDSNLIGSGFKFKTDLLNYLRAYDGQRTICKPLIIELSLYDFSEIHAAIVASVPSKQSVEKESPTSWGWAGLRDVLRSIPVHTFPNPEITIQISSIASLGATDKWLTQTLLRGMAHSKNPTPTKPTFKIVFPTADEVRRSLNGYQSGSAIHTKIQSAAQAKQLQYLKPYLCHWAGDGAQHTAQNLPQNQTQSQSQNKQPLPPTHSALRKRAAPHIKTYIRFTSPTTSPSPSTNQIDWMLVTSANLSKQAWGEAPNAGGEIRICSYEIGVMVWPALWGEEAVMVPAFGRDSPDVEEVGAGNEVDMVGKMVDKEVNTVDKVGKGGKELIVAARMPFDLPLVPYAGGDKPWCTTASYAVPDWKGETWNI